MGYRLISMRCELQKKNLELKDGETLSSYLRKLEKSIKDDWQKLCVKTAAERIDTSQIEKSEGKEKDDSSNEESGVVEFKTKTRKLSQNYNKGVKRYCRFVGCTNSHKTPDIWLERVPKKPDNDKTRKEVRDIVTYEGRKLHRNEILKRIGLSESDKRKELRICSCHDREMIKVPCVINRKKGNPIPIMVEYDMCVPVPLGVKSSNAPISVEREERGLGLDRAAWRVTKDLI